MLDQPSAAQARAAYDAVADAYAAHFPSTEAEPAIDLAMIDHLVSEMGPGARAVLDAGCGTGRMSRYLADRGCAVRGADLSPGMIAVARREHPDLAFDVASIAALPYPGASFDAALYWYSTIHVPDPELPAVLAEAARVLRPGGLALIGFQCGDGLRDVGALYRALGYEAVLTRVSRRPDDVLAIAAAAGFAERARLVRRAVAGERDGQAVLLLQAPGGPRSH